jgi:hypothetical protein
MVFEKMMQESGKKESYGSAIDLARTSIAPRAFNVGPPNYYTQTSFVKKLDVVANITVNDNLANGTQSINQSFTERVSTQTGVIVWLVNRGCASIYRMGIVPTGTIVNNGVTLGGLNNGGRRGMNPPRWAGNASPGAIVLTWANAMAVPYNSTTPADTIKVSPDLGQQFSRTRLFAGDLRVICDTIPIGLTALNGVFSAGSFVDIRDIIQTLEGSNTANCFDPGDLVQQSVTSKDGIKEVSVMQGIVSLVGSDIPPDYTPPDQDPTDTINAGFQSFTYGSNTVTTSAGQTYASSSNGVFNGTNPATQFPAAGQFFNFEGWASPWGTQMKDNAMAGQNAGVVPGSGGGVTNIWTPTTAIDLNINGVLDFRVQVTVLGLSSNNQLTYLTTVGTNPVAVVGVNGNLYTIVLSLSHMYCSCTSANPLPDLAYGVSYQTVEENATTTIDVNETVSALGTGGIQLILESSPKMFIQNFTGGTSTLYANSFGGLGDTAFGMYLGTAITVKTCNYGTVASNNGAIAQIGTVNVQIRARNLYQNGEIGPVRVIRWDSLSDNQQIKVDGVLKVQCIPEGTLAPFVQNASMYSETAHNLNAITFLAELYNGESPIRRNWTGKAYDEFMRTVFPTLSPDLIVQWNSPKLEGIATAAGSFWGGLWDKIKSGAKALAPVAAKALVSSRLGPEAGDMASKAVSGLVGSRGQFGAHGQMAGQFGAMGQMAGSYRGKKRGRKPKRKAGSKAGSTLSKKSLSLLEGRHRSVSQAPTVVSKAGSRGKFSRRSRSHSSRASSATKRRGRKGRKGRKGKAAGGFCAGQMAGKFRRSRSRSHSGSRASSKRSARTKSSFRSKSSRARSMPRDSKGHFVKRR